MLAYGEWPLPHGGDEASGRIRRCAPKQLKTSKLSSAPPRATIGRYTRDWQISTEYKPQRKISDDELNAAKKMFFALDVDSSGSIDADELGVMLRSLGQNPSEAELKALIVRCRHDLTTCPIPCDNHYLLLSLTSHGRLKQLPQSTSRPFQWPANPSANVFALR